MSISARMVAGLGIAGEGPSASEALASSASAAACDMRPRCRKVHARKPDVVATAAAFPRRLAASSAIVSPTSAVASESDQSNAQQAA
jgi:hypothetical protein